jgi:hypothetical protein
MTDAAAIAEDAQAYLPVRPSTRRLDAGDIVLRHTPHSPQFWYGSATRPRFRRSSVDRRIAEVRAWFRDLDRERFMWMVGESATPHGLIDRLVQSGAEPDPDDPESAAMLLDREPPAGPPDISVRRIASLEDYVASMQIVLEKADAETISRTMVRAGQAWAEARDDDQMYTFLAWREDRPIAFGQIVWLTNGLPYLGGATTLSAERSRGAFRALVRARWDEAVRLGRPILLVQAGQMSAPILERLGFRRTGRVWVLRDRSG